MKKKKAKPHLQWGDVPSWSNVATQSIVKSLALVDKQTADHCERVAMLSKLLTRAAGFNDFEQKLAEYSGLLHDVGKIGISKGIIHKPSKLTDEEFHSMMEHPQLSVKAIEPLTQHEFFVQVSAIVKAHHERIDGKGYPDKLIDDEIPILSRAVFIVDAFDAMTQDRPYRKGLPIEIVIEEIKNCSGSQFDSALAKIFLQSYPFWIKEFQEFQQLQKKLKKAG